MLTIEKLRDFGADVDTGLGRCMNNEGFYLKLVEKSLGDKTYDRLKEAIGNNDLDEAFEAAHGLKGVLGNLSLTPIYDPINEITELLRVRTEMDYSDKLGVIISKRDELAELCK